MAVGAAAEARRHHLRPTPQLRAGSAEFLHRVGASRHSQHPDLAPGAERCQASSHRRSRAGRTAIALTLAAMIETTSPGAAHRHSWSTNGSGCSRYPSTP